MPDLTSKGRPWHTFLRQAAFALCVLAVFGMLESPKFAMAIPAINESVFVLNAKNIVIDGAPVEPDVALRTNDAPPLIGSHVRGLAFQLSGFSTRIHDSVLLCRKSLDWNVASQAGLSESGRLRPISNISTHRLQNGWRFAMIFEEKFDRYCCWFNSIAVQGLRNVLVQNSYEQMGSFGLSESIRVELSSISGNISGADSTEQIVSLKGPNQNQHGSERCDGYICRFYLALKSGPPIVWLPVSIWAGFTGIGLLFFGLRFMNDGNNYFGIGIISAGVIFSIICGFSPIFGSAWLGILNIY